MALSDLNKQFFHNLVTFSCSQPLIVACDLCSQQTMCEEMVSIDIQSTFCTCFDCAKKIKLSYWVEKKKPLHDVSDEQLMMLMLKSERLSQLAKAEWEHRNETSRI